MSTTDSLSEALGALQCIGCTLHCCSDSYITSCINLQEQCAGNNFSRVRGAGGKAFEQCNPGLQL